MMSLFWYYRPEHTQGGRNPSAHCEVRVLPSCSASWSAHRPATAPVQPIQVVSGSGFLQRVKLRKGWISFRKSQRLLL